MIKSAMSIFLVFAIFASAAFADRQPVPPRRSVPPRHPVPPRHDNGSIWHELGLETFYHSTVEPVIDATVREFCDQIDEEGLGCATLSTATLSYLILIPEEVIAERGDVALMDADMNGNIIDPIALEALEQIRDEREDVEGLSDVELIKLVQKENE